MCIHSDSEKCKIRNFLYWKIFEVKYFHGLAHNIENLAIRKIFSTNRTLSHENFKMQDPRKVCASKISQHTVAIYGILSM